MIQTVDRLQKVGLVRHKKKDHGASQSAGGSKQGAIGNTAQMEADERDYCIVQRGGLARPQLHAHLVSRREHEIIVAENLPRYVLVCVRKKL